MTIMLWKIRNYVSSKVKNSFAENTIHIVRGELSLSALKS